MIYALCDVIDECSTNTCGWKDPDGSCWASEFDGSSGVVYTYCLGPFDNTFKFIKQDELPNG